MNRTEQLRELFKTMSMGHTLDELSAFAYMKADLIYEANGRQPDEVARFWGQVWMLLLHVRTGEKSEVVRMAEQPEGRLGTFTDETVMVAMYG